MTNAITTGSKFFTGRKALFLNVRSTKAMTIEAGYQVEALRVGGHGYAVVKFVDEIGEEWICTAYRL